MQLILTIYMNCLQTLTTACTVSQLVSLHTLQSTKRLETVIRDSCHRLVCTFLSMLHTQNGTADYIIVDTFLE